MEDAIGGTVAILIMVFVVVLGAFWILMPPLLVNKLNKLIKATEASNLLLNVIANHTRPEGPET